MSTQFGTRGTVDGRFRSNSDGTDRKVNTNTNFWNSGNTYNANSQKPTQWKVPENNYKPTAQRQGFNSSNNTYTTYAVQKPQPKAVVCFNCGENHYKINCPYEMQQRTNLAEQKLLEREKEIEELKEYINNERNETKTNNNYIDNLYQEQVKEQEEYIKQLKKEKATEVSPKKRLNNQIEYRTGNEEDSEGNEKLNNILNEIKKKKQRLELLKAMDYMRELDNEIEKLETKTRKLIVLDDDNTKNISKRKGSNKETKEKKQDKQEKNEKERSDSETRHDEDRSEDEEKKEKSKKDDDNENENENTESSYAVIYDDLIRLIKQKKEKGKYKENGSWRYIRDHMIKILDKRSDSEEVIKYFCRKLGKKINGDKNEKLEEISKILIS